MNKINRTAQYNALPIVAQAWGEKMGVKVRVGGDTACTDGETITIPYVPESFGCLEPIWGYLLHEAQHVKDTDMDIYRDAAMQSPLLGDLVNIFEDVRLERAATMLYPGAQAMLDACATYMVEQEHYQHATSEMSAAQIVAGYCLFYGQLHGVKQSFLQGLLDSSVSALRAKFPRLEQPLNAIIDDSIINMRSTQCAADYSMRVIDLIRDLIKDEQGNAKQQQQQQQQSAEQSESGDPGEGESTNPDNQPESNENGPADAKLGQKSSDEESEDNHGGNGETDSDESKEQESSSSNSGDISSKEGQDSAAGESDGDKPSEQPVASATNDAIKALQDALDAGVDDVLGDVRDGLKRNLMSQHEDKLPVPLPEQTGMSYPPLGRERYKIAMRSGAALRRQFAGLIQSDQYTADRRTRAGRLGNNLASAITGDAKLFLRRGIRQDVGAAVHVLVDISSSMGSETADGKQWVDVAAESSAVMFSALESMPNVSCGLSFYSNTVVKAVRQGQRLAPNQGELGVRPGGTTQTGEAILSVLNDLLCCKHERKQLYVVTDGEPDDGGKLKHAIKVAQSFGIEVYGIGIQLPRVKDYFSNNIVISSVTELRKELLKLARKAL